MSKSQSEVGPLALLFKKKIITAVLLENAKVFVPASASPFFFPASYFSQAEYCPSIGL